MSSYISGVSDFSTSTGDDVDSEELKLQSHVTGSSLASGMSDFSISKRDDVDPKEFQAALEFMNEISMTCKLRHDHIVKAYGAAFNEQSMELALFLDYAMKSSSNMKLTNT